MTGTYQIIVYAAPYTVYHCSGGAGGAGLTSLQLTNVLVPGSGIRLTLDPNGGIYENAAGIREYELTEGSKLNISVPTREGYEFAGWKLSGSGSIGSGVGPAVFTMGASNATITAQWRKPCYMTIDGNGGTVQGKSSYTYKVYVDSSDMSTIPVSYFARIGYTFDGIYTAATDGTQIYDKSGKAVNDGTYWKNGKWQYEGDVTFYAGWKPITYTVNLYAAKPAAASKQVVRQEPAGWTWAADHYTAEFTYDEISTLPELNSAYTLEGWTGVYGWCKSAPASGYDKDVNFNDADNILTPASKVWNLTTEQGKIVNLYAGFISNTYTVRYNGSDNWNTEQLSYTQKLRFDKPETLVANKFTRSPSFTVNGVELKQGYNFIGWSLDAQSWTKAYNDKQGPEVYNMTSVNNEIVDLYAIWERGISLTFDMNGGSYNGSTDNVVLNAKVYNNNYSYPFNFVGELTAESENNYSEQIGSIDGCGDYDKNGINTKYKKGTGNDKYRFIGWSLDPNAAIPDTGLGIGDIKNTKTYNVFNNTILYAVWEPILQVQLQLDRTLGSLNDTLPNRVVATADMENAAIGLAIRPGEQAAYTADIVGNATNMDVAFDKLITDIYEYKGLWTDSLNPNPTTSDDRMVDNIPLSQTHGLDRQPSVADRSHVTRKFYIPQYLGTKQLEGLETITGKQHIGIDTYTMTFTFTNADSYYWKEIKGNPEGEQIEIIGYIYLPNKDGDIPSILDELRTKLKIRLQEYTS